MYGMKVLLSSSSSSSDDDGDERKESVHGRLFLAEVLFVFLWDTGCSVQIT